MSLMQWLKSAGGGGRHIPLEIPAGPHGPVVRRRYHFSGLVQGVGFRYEAKLLAGQLGLTGWVRNKADGTVVIEAEGEADRIDAFLQAMEAVPRFDITEVRAEDLPPSGAETSFQVLY